MVAFVVEDGTGKDDSTSYVDLAFADDYLGASWAVDDTAKQNALISATEYADIRWGGKISGTPVDAEQALILPKNSLYDRQGALVTGIPVKWKRAICLYAQETLTSSLYPDPSNKTSKDVKRKKTVVGPITTELEYQGSATDSSWLSFPQADSYAKLYTNYASGGGARVIRN